METNSDYLSQLPGFCSPECALSANDAGRFYGEWRLDIEHCEECERNAR